MNRIALPTLLVGLLFYTMALTACKLDGGHTDARDGHQYNTVKIGGKVWMSENLNFDYNHGSAKSYCYLNKPEWCHKYGRLYNWEAAFQVCPEGWHLPSKEEFEELVEIAGKMVGSRDKAGFALKSKSGWIDFEGKSGNGIDILGFSALPANVSSPEFDAWLKKWAGIAGLVGAVLGYFDAASEWNKTEAEISDALLKGYITAFWSSTRNTAKQKGTSYCMAVTPYDSVAFSYENRENAYSVRCVKD